MSTRKISSALISVFHKEGLNEIITELNRLGVTIYSTGGTASFIASLGVKVTPVEEITAYPSILGGRVKTLHPKVFGGILARRGTSDDVRQLKEYDIPPIDLVIVDLYPFEETVRSAADEKEIIEKIDIGGVSLIRAAAKNYQDILIVSSRSDYTPLLHLLRAGKGETTLPSRFEFAKKAFRITASYDKAISEWFGRADNIPANGVTSLRYGENPHQKAWYHGHLEAQFEKLHGKELSYNNLVDIDAAVNVISEFIEPTFAIIKHTNTCGLASRLTLGEAWPAALACDPVSAFGGIIACNGMVDEKTAAEINNLFFEVIIAPDYEPAALALLKLKKNRIILIRKNFSLPAVLSRTVLGGRLEQENDLRTETAAGLKAVTAKAPSPAEVEDLLFAAKAVKHLKSNGIALVKNKQLAGMGCGQTSRVSALKQAIEKAGEYGFSLKGAVMASDAFFPFPDCVEIAHKAGITAVIQPGGSVKDQDSVDFCNQAGMAMVFTGTRHFRH